MTPETDEQHLIRLLKLEQAVIRMVTERTDRLCWRDLYTELAGLVGIEFTPALICDQKQFLANCKAFDDSLRTGGQYTPVYVEAQHPQVADLLAECRTWKLTPAEFAEMDGSNSRPSNKIGFSNE